VDQDQLNPYVAYEGNVVRVPHNPQVERLFWKKISVTIDTKNWALFDKSQKKTFFSRTGKLPNSIRDPKMQSSMKCAKPFATKKPIDMWNIKIIIQVLRNPHKTTKASTISMIGTDNTIALNSKLSSVIQ
jgi:hypothetical protein